MNEAELIARAKRGDAAAYEQLVRMDQGIAFRTAWLVAGNAADAEEAAQDSFVKAHRSLVVALVVVALAAALAVRPARGAILR